MWQEYENFTKNSVANFNFPDYDDGTMAMKVTNKEGETKVMLLELDKKVELEIIDLALTHIKKVEADPEVETDGDNFDYWNSYELEDGTFCGLQYLLE